MDILAIVIVLFVVLESLNIGILYLAPGSRRGNGIGVFRAYEESRSHPNIRALVSYLINWVAGTKLIFVSLLIVILLTGSATTKLYTVVALIISILSFFWRLFPAIRKMDEAGQIVPRGYSRTLGLMILSFVLCFVAALVAYLLFGFTAL